MAPKPVVMRRPIPAMYPIIARRDPPNFEGTAFATGPFLDIIAGRHGRVTEVGKDEDGRKFVWMWCELPGVSCRMLYAGLSRVAVKVGQHVKEEEIIGSMPAGASELYLEVRTFPGNESVAPDFYDDYLDERVFRVLPKSNHQ
jgi:murein DD-endopeptidase MepM/ murein hydrolase activator NlpD